MYLIYSFSMLYECLQFHVTNRDLKFLSSTTKYCLFEKEFAFFFLLIFEITFYRT